MAGAGSVNVGVSAETEVVAAASGSAPTLAWVTRGRAQPEDAWRCPTATRCPTMSTQGVHAYTRTRDSTACSLTYPTAVAVVLLQPLCLAEDAFD